MVYEQYAFLAGRILLGGFFVVSGFNHFMNRETMAGYAGSKGVPSPDLMIAVTGLMLLAGGASILTGAYVTVGAALLVLFLLGTSFIIHDFWNMDGEQRMQEQVQFMKDMALLGAVLTLLIVPAWPYALNMGL